MIPLVSSLCEGPLGVAHLPRIWWKNILHQAGELDEAYPHCSGGLDARVLEVLKLDKEQTLQHLFEQKPDYLQFEAWVEEHGTVHGPSIERWNAALRSRTHYIPGKIDETGPDPIEMPSHRYDLTEWEMNQLIASFLIMYPLDVEAEEKSPPAMEDSPR